MSIYVGNLPHDATEAELTTLFVEYGSVKRVKMPTGRETGRMLGFAFIEMSAESEEVAAIEALDGNGWMGCELRVNKAKPHESRSDNGFSRGY